MPTRVVSRPEEARAVAAFLGTAAAQPSGLVAEGEPGIGKTTLCLSTIEVRRTAWISGVVGTPAEAESVLAYASLADLLSGVDSSVLTDLPTPQRLRDRSRPVAGGSRGSDHRSTCGRCGLPLGHRATGREVTCAGGNRRPAVARSVQPKCSRVRRATTFGQGRGVRDRPDRPRRRRRVRRHGCSCRSPTACSGVQIRPLSLGGLNAVITQRLGRSLSRPAIVRIQEVSGGNPFYALELARAMDGDVRSAEMPMPMTLTELVPSPDRQPG